MKYYSSKAEMFFYMTIDDIFVGICSFIIRIDEQIKPKNSCNY